MYLALEYAVSGELFDRIAPDVGVDERLAHMYFTQLMAGVAYLHSVSIAHRGWQNVLINQILSLKTCFWINSLI
jgi:serine/threonine-protein kinase Chk1